MNRSLIVGPFGGDVKESDLERVLFQGLQVKSIQLISGSSESSKDDRNMKALVEFASVEDAKNGLQRNGLQFKGSRLE